jgi:hypothetical protein
MRAQAMTPSERADACLAALDRAGQAIARRVVLRLIRFGDDGAAAGRPQPMSALQSRGDSGRLADIVRHLTEGGLLRRDGDGDGDAAGAAQIELADDALIGGPTLQRWIASHGKTEQLRRQLEADAAEWQLRASQGTPAAGLLDRAQLAELTAWLVTDPGRELGISDPAASFIAASRAASRRRWWPGRTSIGGALAVLLILMILATPITLASLIALTAAMIHKFL